MSYINQAIVVVLIVAQVAGQINMVDPDVLGCLNSDCVAVVSKDLADLQVSHNDVGLSVNGQTDTSECYDPILVSDATETLFSRGALDTYSCRTCQ